MSIQVICPGCHTRFKVSDKFAGKEGACPKCKGTIQVPTKSEEVVVHAPEHSEMGALDEKGRPVLKPVARKDTKFKPLVMIGVIAAVVIVFLIAWIQKGNASEVILAAGAALLGPPLAYAGYLFLRDPELEAFQGKALWIRSLICGLIYALLWCVLWFVKGRLFGDVAAGENLELFQILVLAIPFLGAGTLAAFASYDFDPGSGFFHYALYLLVTILLRVTIGLTIV